MKIVILSMLKYFNLIFNLKVKIIFKSKYDLNYFCYIKYTLMYLIYIYILYIFNGMIFDV